MTPPSLPEHLYIHFPFCTGRCGYCAFISGQPPHDPIAVIDALCREKAARHLAFAPLKTLYCGGGTPGLIGSVGFRALVAADLFTFAPHAEWTVELHPATVTPELIETLAECGVNRISIGVQSLDDTTLDFCNRRHTAQQALDAVACARAVIPDTGIDLIAGLPTVTHTLWRDTLQRVCELDLPHLSVYALSIDEGSAWAKQGISPPEPNELCDLVAETAAKLEAVGLERYETSNYARRGFRCKHNLNTWHGGDYVGLGYGAASRLGKVRRDGLGHEETLSPLDDALERTLTRLRLNEPFDLPALCREFPLLVPFSEAWERLLARFRDQGFLTFDNTPTTRGYEVLDALECDLYAAACK